MITHGMRGYYRKMVQRIMAANAFEIAEHAALWIESEWKVGAAIFALEGLMGSGKTTLAKQIKLHLPTVQHMELDAHLIAGQPSWDQSLVHREAEVIARAHLRTRMPVLVEGAIAWPTVRALLPPELARRIYLKRMQFPGFWADEDQLTEALEEPSVRRSIRDYHYLNQPWAGADLVLERLVDEETGE